MNGNRPVKKTVLSPPRRFAVDCDRHAVVGVGDLPTAAQVAPPALALERECT